MGYETSAIENTTMKLMIMIARVPEYPCGVIWPAASIRLMPGYKREKNVMMEKIKAMALNTFVEAFPVMIMPSEAQ